MTSVQLYFVGEFLAVIFLRIFFQVLDVKKYILVKINWYYVCKSFHLSTRISNGLSLYITVFIKA